MSTSRPVSFFNLDNNQWFILNSNPSVLPTRQSTQSTGSPQSPSTSSPAKVLSSTLLDNKKQQIQTAGLKRLLAPSDLDNIFSSLKRKRVGTNNQSVYFSTKKVWTVQLLDDTASECSRVRRVVSWNGGQLRCITKAKYLMIVDGCLIIIKQRSKMHLRELAKWFTLGCIYWIWGRWK